MSSKKMGGREETLPPETRKKKGEHIYENAAQRPVTGMCRRLIRRSFPGIGSPAPSDLVPIY